MSSSNLFDLMWEDILFPNLVPYLTNEDLLRLFLCSKQCQNFANLAMKFVKNFEIIETTEQFTVNWYTMVYHCTNLRSVKVSSSFNRDLFMQLLINNPNLRSLDMGNLSERVFSYQLLPVIITLRNLEEFTASVLEERHFIVIFENLPNLKQITMTYITDNLGLAISKNCPNIERMKVHKGIRITKEIVM